MSEEYELYQKLKEAAEALEAYQKKTNHFLTACGNQILKGNLNL